MPMAQSVDNSSSHHPQSRFFEAYQISWIHTISAFSAQHNGAINCEAVDYYQRREGL